MPATFSLTVSDYQSLERAVLARFQRKQGRFNSAWFAQVFAWMFATLAVMTFYKQWQRAPEVAQAFAAVVILAVIAFLFASLRPLAGQWIYRRYVAAWDHSFTKQQSVDLENGLLLLNSATAKSAIPSSAIIDHTEDERNHYLFVTGVQAITIPKVAGAALGTEFIAFLAAIPSET